MNNKYPEANLSRSFRNKTRDKCVNKHANVTGQKQVH